MSKTPKNPKAPESYEYFPIKGANTKAKSLGSPGTSKKKLSGPGEKPAKNAARKGTTNSKYGDR